MLIQCVHSDDFGLLGTDGKLHKRHSGVARANKSHVSLDLVISLVVFQFFTDFPWFFLISIDFSFWANLRVRLTRVSGPGTFAAIGFFFFCLLS